ncbi:hypothetical protein CY34DRAFT_813793 [Suillus luteus UH-Slu-Lm8-n1]|uniref:Uncharacterized protein n=1 Tax=Suillus luteus UH-Slu-Lm8-n1 TaxID=930992 RepID=A0A0C9Z6R8_9AGAM|nr:hypothetical protein CY34DRAFT_813793 [Suillus luteus UH-Slu-Lm8-n1]
MRTIAPPVELIKKRLGGPVCHATPKFEFQRSTKIKVCILWKEQLKLRYPES